MSRLFVLPLLLLVGCEGREVKECPAPTTTTIKEYVYVPIDEALTAPVEDTAPSLTTVRSAVVAAKARQEGLAVCNARLEQIRRVGSESQR